MDCGLLDVTQFGFVLNGSCVEPLTVMNAIYNQGKGGGKAVHTAFLDATGAFDSVPHVALDVALWRLGAGEGFVTWLRSLLQGHSRVIATAYGVSEYRVAQDLQAGEPKACTTSPTMLSLNHL